MADKSVRVSKTVTATPDTVWSIVRDFCAPWHPAIASMIADCSGGHLTRVFSVHGAPTEYHERLTWFSDSERAMAYTHVGGIDGVQAYDARLWVAEEDSTGAVVTMAANLCAEEPRATDIATGTQAIFKSGLDALAELAQVGQAAPKVAAAQEGTPVIKTRMIGDTPRLAVSTTSHPSSDTLVLFLHGIGGARLNWDQQMAALAPVCNTASLDLRGYGDSTLGPAQSTIEDYCNDINTVADAFKARRLVLCGLSYGAWIATSYGMRHPDRLSALILAGGCTGMSEADQTTRDGFREARQKPLDAGQTPADFAADVIPILAGPDCSKAVENELRASMSAIPAATYADALHCFTNPPEAFDFSRLSMPVLMMTGEFDRLAPPDEIKSVAQRIFDASPTPDVRFECMPRAGHLCNLETPDAFNRPLVELIQRIAL